jgi:hypothetical protein
VASAGSFSQHDEGLEHEGLGSYNLKEHCAALGVAKVLWSCQVHCSAATALLACGQKMSTLPKACSPIQHATQLPSQERPRALSMSIRHVLCVLQLKHLRPSLLVHKLPSGECKQLSQPMCQRSLAIATKHGLVWHEGNIINNTWW